MRLEKSSYPTYKPGSRFNRIPQLETRYHCKTRKSPWSDSRRTSSLSSRKTRKSSRPGFSFRAVNGRRRARRSLRHSAAAPLLSLHPCGSQRVSVGPGQCSSGSLVFFFRKPVTYVTGNCCRLQHFKKLDCLYRWNQIEGKPRDAN